MDAIRSADLDNRRNRWRGRDRAGGQGVLLMQLAAPRGGAVGRCGRAHGGGGGRRPRTLEGITVGATGSLQGFKRDFAKAGHSEARRQGLRSVSRKAHFLAAGRTPGPSLQGRVAGVFRAGPVGGSSGCSRRAHAFGDAGGHGPGRGGRRRCPRTTVRLPRKGKRGNAGGGCSRGPGPGTGRVAGAPGRWCWPRPEAGRRCCAVGRRRPSRR
ncbi:hypothetical protein QJS66_07330 [Kocuria rhizophila]|nr:hypothetical protein QJS66_07330 [Kocuria rhizophila]